MAESSFPALLDALKTAPTAPDAKAAADRLAREVAKQGLESLNEQGVIKGLSEFALNKKSGYERESGALGFQYLASILGVPVGPILLGSLQTIMDLYADKGEVVRAAATAATKTIIKLFPPESVRRLYTVFTTILEDGKWQTKVGALDAMRTFVDRARPQVARELGWILPKVEKAMHDTKREVASAANKCAAALCTTVANPDITPHIPVLVKCMADPDSVPTCMKALASTTFVAEVTAPALAILVPLLMRALNDRSMDVQRRTVVVIDNLVKLVRDPNVAATHLSGLVDGVDRIMNTASFPEVRAFAEAAHNTLITAGASSTAPPPIQRDIATEENVAMEVMISHLPPSLRLAGQNKPKSLELKTTMSFVASLVADLNYLMQFDDATLWHKCVGMFLTSWLSIVSNDPRAFSEEVRKHFEALDKAKHGLTINGNDEEGELLCDTQFSLAYGTLLLLSHTRLRLMRGHRYGILGTNGSGKSTLLRQLKEGKVENFPPQEQLRCVMVEHALQGEDTSFSVVDFIAADPALSGVSRSEIVARLNEVGFDQTRQSDTVGGLSGGWKMRLELARGMLHNADLLLLDEPTNHLDPKSVKWLEDYLLEQKNVTCLLISHDSGFLDHVTTDIIHFEQKKLAYYPGSLSTFVEKHPEAKSYYTLAATSVKFSFPAPGSLMGVRSNTRAILKMNNSTYTYPGKTSPSLANVSCALSLSSRVGVVGPNGAGKSTLIKLLTGEAEPQEGTVYKHPALRIGYVSQHATHHIERHLEKTPIQYIQWRFQDGHDRELLEKATRVLTEEEKAQMAVEFVGKNGTKRKLELLLGRQKLKKSLQYEIKWQGLDHKFNTWVPRETLIAKGFTKVVQQFDDLEASREGAGQRDTAANLVRKHLEDIGLDGDIAQYNEISGLSGGQKIKLVIAACLWNNPQICILDEPTNFLDREALGGLAVAIRDWGGAVVIISHNMEFVHALCPEIWQMEAGKMTHKGKAAVVEDAFADSKSQRGSRVNTPVRSRNQTPLASRAASPAVSGAEDRAGAGPVVKKKKLTRNQIKAQEERRRIRKLNWLTFGGPKPEDTDSD